MGLRDVLKNAVPVTWLYKTANINANDYRDELLNLFSVYVPDINQEIGNHFLPIGDHNLIKQHCPKLMAKIASWGIDNRLAECAFIILPPGQQFPIHRDYPKWEFRNIGLLMPVINCNDTYTAFYDAEVLPDTLKGITGDNPYANRSQQVNEITAEEIDRCDSSQAHWINVYQPHAPRSNHNEYRVTFSMRFRPELFDLMSSGKFDQDLVQ